MNVRKRSALVVAIVALAGIAALAAGSVYALTVEVPARGTFTSQHGKTELLRGIGRLTGEPADAVVQKLVLEAGEGPNWHTHAGPVTVIVKSGKFTYVDDDCSETTYNAGQAFVDEGFGHVHRAYNPGPGTTEVWAVYVIPQGAGLIIPSSPVACAA
jgi:quercetin dioxygenase-like cupin family protein